MMPALLITAFSAGNSAISFAARAAMLAGSAISSTIDCMPGLAAVGGVEIRLAASGDDDLVAELVELLGDAEADARAAAGDEDGVSGEIHRGS